LPSRRWVYLDVLRAVAILMVLGAHSWFRLPEGTFLQPLFALWKRIGWIGVDLFFVLSGFLIGGLLFAEQRRRGTIEYGRFFLRRCFKIWPPYLVFLTATFAWDVRDGPGRFSTNLWRSARSIWPYLVHAQNYYAPLVERIGHAWSLAVEEHFYLLLPLLLAGMTWFASRRRGDAEDRPATPFRAIPWVCLGLVLVCLGLRWMAWRAEPEFDPFAHDWPTHVRIDSLFVGVALAWAVQFAPARIEALRPWRLAIAGLSIACFVPVAGRGQFDSALVCTIGYTLLAVGSAGLVLVAWWASQATEAAGAGEGSCAARKRLPTRALARVGAYSYSIYLWHMPFTMPIVMSVERRIGLWDSPLHYGMTMVIYIAASIALGALMYHTIELRSLALRDRWFPAQRGPAAQAEESEPVESRAAAARGTADELAALGSAAGELQPAM
jgi:peptidoglycan/LPS O-acetylase OafA/YrhL